MDYGSKWHKLRKAIDDGRLLLVASADGQEVAANQSFKSRSWHKSNQLLKLLAHYEDSAHFVISEGLLHLLLEKKAQFSKSLIEMAEAGLLRLPFDRMVLEMPDPDVVNATMFVSLQQDDDGVFQMYKFDLTRDHLGRDAAVFWPVDARFSLRSEDAGVPLGEMMLKFSIQQLDIPGNDLDVGRSTADAFKFSSSMAMIFGCMLWRTRGLAKERVSAPVKLNKARVSAVKRPCATTRCCAPVAFMIARATPTKLRPDLRRSDEPLVPYGWLERGSSCLGSVSGLGMV